MWVEPITDRRKEDIIEQTDKAFCNVSDMQRVEGNCQLIAEKINVTISTKTNWSQIDYLKTSEFARILQNIHSLRSAYYVYPDTPNTPNNPLNHFEKWNDIEKILQDLYVLYSANVHARIYTGECFAGEAGVI